MNPSYHFPQLEHFTSGTVGPKGQRTFFLQFGNSGDLVSLKLEKGQVHALAEYLNHLLEDIDVLEADVPLALDLIEPVEAPWAIANIGIAFQEDEQEFVLVVEELGEQQPESETEAEPQDLATAQLHLSPGQAQAFVNRSRQLVASGRPPCKFCGQPLNHDDAWCACYN